MRPIKNFTDQDKRSMHKHNNRTPSPDIITQHPVNITNEVSSSSSLTIPNFTDLINKSDGEKLSTRTHINSSLLFPTVNPKTSPNNTSTNKLFGGIEDITHKPYNSLNTTFPPNKDESHLTTQQYYLRGNGKHVHRDQNLKINNLESSGPTQNTDSCPINNSGQHQTTNGIPVINKPVLKNSKSTHNEILSHRHNATKLSKTKIYSASCSFPSIVSSPKKIRVYIVRIKIVQTFDIFSSIHIIL